MPLPVAAFAVAAAVLAAAPAPAQTEWKFNNSYAPTRVESGHIRAFAENVGARSGGRLKIAVLEGGAMGLRDADALRWMQAGVPEMGFIWPPFLGRDAPDLATLYVYGSISTMAEHSKALPALKAAMAEGLKKRNIEVVGFMGISVFDGSVFCRQPVRSLDELKRYKLRVGTRDQIETFKGLGVAAQTIPQGDLYSALQTGVVDCALYAARIAHTISLQEVTKHAVYSGFPFPPVPYAVMVNQAKWTALADDLKAAIRAAAAELERASFDLSKEEAEAKEAIDKLKAQGVTFYPDFSKADQDAIRRAALATWETLAKEGGEDAVKNRERVVNALRAN